MDYLNKCLTKNQNVMEKAKVVVVIIAVIYKKLLRNELIKLVEKTESQVDDQVIGILDKLLLEVDTSK